MSKHLANSNTLLWYWQPEQVQMVSYSRPQVTALVDHIAETLFDDEIYATATPHNLHRDLDPAELQCLMELLDEASRSSQPVHSCSVPLFVSLSTQH